MRSTRVPSGRVATTLTLVLFRPTPDRSRARATSSVSMRRKARRSAVATAAKSGASLRPEPPSRARREIEADGASVAQFLALVLPRLSIQHAHDELRRRRQLEAESLVQRDRFLARQPECEQALAGCARAGRGRRIARRSLPRGPSPRSPAADRPRAPIGARSSRSGRRTRPCARVRRRRSTDSVGSGNARSGAPSGHALSRVIGLGSLSGLPIGVPPVTHVSSTFISRGDRPGGLRNRPALRPRCRAACDRRASPCGSIRPTAPPRRGSSATSARRRRSRGSGRTDRAGSETHRRCRCTAR